MGRWRITIDGTGCHHNGKRDIDADLVAKDMVDELRGQGHMLHGARFEMVSGEAVVESPLNVDYLEPAGTAPAPDEGAES